MTSKTLPIELPAGPGRILVAARLENRPFTRLYLREPSDLGVLMSAVDRGYDYVFAYSHVDFGDLEGFSKQQKWAQILSLEGTRDDVYMTLGKKPRQEVNKTYRNEDIRVVVDGPDTEMAMALYEEVKKADGAVPDIEEDFTGVRWITGYYQGELLAANSVYDSGSILRGKHCFSRRRQEGVDTALVGNLNRRLLWEACEIGIAEGRDFFDMGGLDFDDPSKSGITEYKLRFGGEPKRIFVYRWSSPEWESALSEARERGRSVL